MSFGPLQIVAFGLREAVLPTSVVDLFRDAQNAGFLRICDSVVIAKDSEGGMTAVEELLLPGWEHELAGALAFALLRKESAGIEGALQAASSVVNREFGLAERDLEEFADLLPRDSLSLFMLIEHRWAIPLTSALAASGGQIRAYGWISPATLVSVGSELDL